MEVLENRPLQSSTLRYSLEVASKTDIVMSNSICFVYFDLFCIFYILLRLIRWDHYQILVHIYHRGHVVSQLLARHLWDW